MEHSIKHIAFICSRLDLPGGIERAIVNTANLFSEKGHEVKIIILDETRNSFYPIHSQVRVLQHPLFFGITEKGNLISRKTAFIHDTLRLRRILKALHVDIVIPTEYPFAIAAVLAGGKKFAEIISWEHHHFHELERNFFWNQFFKLTYPKLEKIVTLNEDEKKLFQSLNTNVLVIPNFVEHFSTLRQASGQVSQPSLSTLLTVARLTQVKGIDLLLKAAKIVLSKHHEWKWKIIGDGEMKEELLDFIGRENLQNKLILQPPITHDIRNEYKNASIYVMSSRNECFPMTLLEAMSVGLPCVAFDCDTGPRHIISHNEDGILVENENPEKLAEAISLLINNDEERKSMSRKASENIHRFSADKIYSVWEKTILKAEL